MELSKKASRYMSAVDALHTLHSSTDVHDEGGFAGQALTEHCALICNDTGDRFNPSLNEVIHGDPPHKAVLEEYEAAKSELEEALLSE